jgi:hypothetical protein
MFYAILMTSAFSRVSAAAHTVAVSNAILRSELLTDEQCTVLVSQLVNVLRDSTK